MMNFLSSLLLLAVSPMLEVAGQCLTDVGMITQQELGLAAQILQSGGDLSQIPPREYILCEDTIFSIGIPSETGGPLDFENGTLPLATIVPAMTVKCGDGGSSSGNCTLLGGVTQFLAPGDEILEQLGFGPIPTDISGLRLEGLTFKGTQGPPVTIEAPGDDIVFNDCLFLENVCFDTLQLYAANTVRITSSTFEENFMVRSIVYAGANSTVDVDSVLFVRNEIPGNMNYRGAVVDYASGAGGSITSSCFIENTAASPILLSESSAEVVLGDDLFISNVQHEGLLCEGVLIEPDIEEGATTCDPLVSTETCSLLDAAPTTLAPTTPPPVMPSAAPVTVSPTPEVAPTSPPPTPEVAPTSPPPTPAPTASSSATKITTLKAALCGVVVSMYAIYCGY